MSRLAVVAATLASSILFADAAQGQLAPYGFYGGGFGPFALPSRGVVPRSTVAAEQGATQRLLMQQNFQQRQNQNAALSQQALRNTQWMANQQGNVAAARAAQVQNMSALRLASAGPSGADPAAADSRTGDDSSQYFGPGKRWPSVLYWSEFDGVREPLDALVQKAEVATSGLTSADYEEMAGYAREMKKILGLLQDRINGPEFAFLSAYVDRLIAAYEKAANPTP